MVLICRGQQLLRNKSPAKQASVAKNTGVKFMIKIKDMTNCMQNNLKQNKQQHRQQSPCKTYQIVSKR